ncbi:MAG TPA: YicC/YloC family endoribonuclease [Gemmatimonadaceae bacterium]|nr:YicC/YloC family endoribonuclease [Gemmatimonadaceae bacterium]
MTGFGAATGRFGAQRVTVELRTVNHRFFNSNIKLPGVMARWEGDVREVLRQAIARGHVSLSARTERDAPNENVPMVDERRFADYVEVVRGLQQRHGLSTEIDVSTILRLPDVLGSDTRDESGTVEELTAIVQDALTALTRMRDAEGARIEALLEERITIVGRAVDRIAARAPERLVGERERLRESVKELSGGIDVDPQRLAQEIAILADRLDVAEEVDRFRAHVGAFRSALHAQKDGQVGKRLGFLLQEMLREANTTGSKARDATMTHDVVAVKEELERIAEQVENVE